jgi:hypothetical protein
MNTTPASSIIKAATLLVVAALRFPLLRPLLGLRRRRANIVRLRSFTAADPQCNKATVDLSGMDASDIAVTLKGGR